MPTPSNPSFEIEGATAGLAQDWNLMWQASGSQYTDFSGGTPPKLLVEDYDVGWNTEDFTAEIEPPGEPTQFDEGLTVSAVESYNFWADNEHYRETITVHIDAKFDADTLFTESYDGWDDNANYVTDILPGVSPVSEDYEAGWGNDTYVTSFTTGTLSLFKQGAFAFENYEDVQPDVVFFVADVSTDVLGTAAPHGLSDNFAVTVLTDGTRPGGLVANQVYYLRDTGPSQFKLAKTVGGPAVDITSEGIGTHSIHADETLYWTQ